MGTAGRWAMRIGTTLAVLGAAVAVINVFASDTTGTPRDSYHVAFLKPGESCADRLTLYIDQTSGSELICSTVGLGYADPYSGPLTDDEKSEVLQQTAAFGDGGLDEADRARVEQVLDAIAARHPVPPATTAERVVTTGSLAVFLAGLLLLAVGFLMSELPSAVRAARRS